MHTTKVCYRAENEGGAFDESDYLVGKFLRRATIEEKRAAGNDITSSLWKECSWKETNRMLQDQMYSKFQRKYKDNIPLLREKMRLYNLGEVDHQEGDFNDEISV